MNAPQFVKIRDRFINRNAIAFFEPDGPNLIINFIGHERQQLVIESLNGEELKKALFVLGQIPTGV